MAAVRLPRVARTLPLPTQTMRRDRPDAVRTRSPGARVSIVRSPVGVAMRVPARKQTLVSDVPVRPSDWTWKVFAVVAARLNFSVKAPSVSVSVVPDTTADAPAENATPARSMVPLLSKPLNMFANVDPVVCVPVIRSVVADAANATVPEPIFAVEPTCSTPACSVVPPV